ncbi:hypothetical protein PROFUN_06680 [Planoprotostelium fungivorum]|uniref:Ubiquitin-like domain-containing protein n=1 Tax=Planoprotostelium fungivorum TaxID=1890364 RepID=A0A2P6NG16_9EUKA|nr:hypothetical protein PROFUN_06680 [Planoprotostelium fungivorum]
MVAVIISATGETLQTTQRTLSEIQSYIQETKGIPVHHQVLSLQRDGVPLRNEDVTSEGPLYLSMSLNGGCGVDCGCCGLDCGVCCSII